LFGIFGLLAALFQLLFWALIIAAIVVVVRYFMNLSKIPEEEIIQRWGQLLPGQSALSSEWLNRVDTELKTRAFPFDIYRESISEGISGQRSQEFLVCQLNGDYMCYIGQIAIGNDLHVNWSFREKRASGCFNFPIIGPF